MRPIVIGYSNLISPSVAVLALHSIKQYWHGCFQALQLALLDFGPNLSGKFKLCKNVDEKGGRASSQLMHNGDVEYLRDSHQIGLWKDFNNKLEGGNNWGKIVIDEGDVE